MKDTQSQAATDSRLTQLAEVADETEALLQIFNLQEQALPAGNKGVKYRIDKIGKYDSIPDNQNGTWRN